MAGIKRPADDPSDEPSGKKNQAVTSKVFPSSKPARENSPPPSSNITKPLPSPNQNKTSTQVNLNSYYYISKLGRKSKSNSFTKYWPRLCTFIHVNDDQITTQTGHLVCVNRWLPWHQCSYLKKAHIAWYQLVVTAEVPSCPHSFLSLFLLGGCGWKI